MPFEWIAKAQKSKDRFPVPEESEVPLQDSPNEKTSSKKNLPNELSPSDKVNLSPSKKSSSSR